MFWNRFTYLCNEAGEAPNVVAAKCGVKSSGTVTGWKNGATPRAGVLSRIADYFGVQVSELTGEKQKKPSADSRELIGPKKQALIDKVKIMSDSEVDAFLTLLDR